MFARKVTMQLKPYTVAEFTRLMDMEIIPLLRKQKGFLDQVSFLLPGEKEVFGISFWELKEHADNYNISVYPQVTKLLDKYLETPPKVETFEVLNSTFHKFVARVAA